MKRLLFFISLLLFGVTVNSQLSETKIKLSSTEHDFGTFKEEAGRQTFDFVITNIGTNPLVIQKVVASCGCTTPEWTRQPIPSGGTGRLLQYMTLRTILENSIRHCRFIQTLILRLLCW